MSGSLLGPQILLLTSVVHAVKVCKAGCADDAQPSLRHTNCKSSQRKRGLHDVHTLRSLPYTTDGESGSTPREAATPSANARRMDLKNDRKWCSRCQIPFHSAIKPHSPAPLSVFLRSRDSRILHALRTRPSRDTEQWTSFFANSRCPSQLIALTSALIHALLCDPLACAHLCHCQCVCSKPSCGRQKHGIFGLGQASSPHPTNGEADRYVGAH
ncbi:hypothetical protein DFH07DRAFT_806877 [Mycena maculata]|uniref:Secreted protein n=1 Tax=Mycena maculata TaxID=230809 RepID=A0AAD7NP39_9AGAR|nr:hypothetical protein DFH07DRAFT_806877 [Mycena maculata]